MRLRLASLRRVVKSDLPVDWPRTVDWNRCAGFFPWLFLLVFRDDVSDRGLPSTEQDCKSVLREVFGGMGWEASKILAAMDGASEIYFDRVSQIRMDQWTKGRTALVGDAGACIVAGG